MLAPPHNAGPRELTDFDVRLQEMDACGAFDHHPTLKVALGHLGEGLPFWTRRTDNRYSWTYQAAGKAHKQKPMMSRCPARLGRHLDRPSSAHCLWRPPSREFTRPGRAVGQRHRPCSWGWLPHPCVRRYASYQQLQASRRFPVRRGRLCPMGQASVGSPPRARVSPSRSSTVTVSAECPRWLSRDGTFSAKWMQTPAS
jgi:hypothetical protein